MAVLAVVAGALVVLGRRHRGTPTERWFSRAFAVVFAVVLVQMEISWLLRAQSGIEHALPLHLCDLAAIAAVWALWSQSSTAFALTYFWGLTLTVQAFHSPELNGPDFPSVQFLSFFGLHSLVVWAAIYLTWGVGLRPGWRSYRVAMLVTIVWGMVVFAFNSVAGTNYGFLNAKPLAASPLDVLGPWPWYLLTEFLLGAAVWAAITYPWTRRPESRPAASVPAAPPTG